MYTSVIHTPIGALTICSNGAAVTALRFGVFQQEVWALLRTIPYGSTLSYGQVAAALGRPRAARAVGLANNRNPIPIIIPCHRVVGSSGKLVGYAGGLPIKETLLELEARHP